MILNFFFVARIPEQKIGDGWEKLTGRGARLPKRNEAASVFFSKNLIHQDANPVDIVIADLNEYTALLFQEISCEE